MPKKLEKQFVRTSDGSSVIVKKYVPTFGHFIAHIPCVAGQTDILIGILKLKKKKYFSYICTLDSFSLPLTTEKQIFTSWRNFFQKFYSSRSIHVNTIFKILICLVIVIQRQLGSNGIFQYLTYFRIILNVIEPPKVRMIFLV